MRSVVPNAAGPSVAWVARSGCGRRGEAHQKQSYQDPFCHAKGARAVRPALYTRLVELGRQVRGFTGSAAIPIFRPCSSACVPAAATAPPAAFIGLGQLRVTGVSMIGRSLLILLAVISLSACSYPGAYSTSRDVKFSKRGITQQQLDADWSDCRKENTVAMSFAEAYTEAKRPSSFAEEYLINGCMAARGYTVTW